MNPHPARISIQMQPRRIWCGVMNRVLQPAVQHRIQKTAEQHLFGKRSDRHSEKHHEIRALLVLEKLVHGQRFGNGQKTREQSQAHGQQQRLWPYTRATNCPASASPLPARKDAAGAAWSPPHTWLPAWPGRPASCWARSPAAQDSCSVPRRKCLGHGSCAMPQKRLSS